MGIIGWYCLRVYIDGGVWYFDVGLLYSGVEVGFKGMVVCYLKWYVSWV